MKMRVLISVGLVLCLMFPVLSRAELFPMPPMQDDEVTLLYFMNPKEEKQYKNKQWGIDPFNTVMRIVNRIEETPKGKKLIQLRKKRLIEYKRHESAT